MNIGQSIFDILSIIIGFITIVLLLSLVVTALVQATQATIRLRARNLKKGINALLDNVFGNIESIKNKNNNGLAAKNNKELAAQVLNSSNIAILGKKKDPNSFWAKIKGPTVSYIKPEDLPQALMNAGIQLDREKVRKVKVTFDKLWGQLEKRFLFNVRIITIGWALIVAAYFQVSAPELLRNLSVDPALRASITAETEDIVNKVKENLETLSDWQEVSEKALQRLEDKYPDLKEHFEEVSGIGDDKETLIEELNNVLTDSNINKSEITETYESILDELYNEKKQAALDQANSTMNLLAKFNITGWSKGVDFYVLSGDIQWNNVIGIIITAALLTFGAPFWFERLQEVTKLKDMLSEGIKPKKDGKRH